MDTDKNAAIVFKFPAGVDNRSREYALSEGSARVIDNLDVTRDGGIRCRNGLRRVWSTTCHSSFAHPRGLYLLMVRDGILGRMDRMETWSALTAVTGPVVYAVLDDEVYWSDGFIAGRVKTDGSLAPWGLVAPGFSTPVAVNTGSLSEGSYQIAMTSVHSTGLESGAREAVIVTLTTIGGIQVTAPTSSSYTFNVYVAPLYGGSSELRYAATLTGGGSTIIGNITGGRRLDSLLAINPPPSQCLCTHKGRLWAASGQVLWFTSEKSPHWVFPASSYYTFESTITMLGAAEDGIYVGLADRVYYLQGADPLKMTRRLVSSIGALPGGGQDIPTDLFIGQSGFPSRQCVWDDINGLLSIGKPGGIIIRPSSDRYAGGVANSGRISYRETNGIRQIVSVLDSTDSIIGNWQAVDVAFSDVFTNNVVLRQQSSTDIVIAYDQVTV